MKLLGIEMSLEEFDALMCEQAKGKELKVVDGKVVAVDRVEPPKTQEEIIEELRQRREQECFTIINRGSLWYDNLSGLQLEELEEWYHKWLMAPQTLEVPDKPEWLK